MSQLIISLNGIDERVLKKNINGVLISETDKIKIDEKYTLLQANFSSIDDLIKAKQIIKDQNKANESLEGEPQGESDQELSDSED